MNCMSLRVTSGVKNTKNTMSLPPVVLANFPHDTGPEIAWIGSFLQATTADEQLAILKKKLHKADESIDCNVLQLLVVAFFHSPAKHPVKCYLNRYITKSKKIQEPFIKLLVAEITVHISNDDYKLSEPTSCASFYKDTVSKFVWCVENFASGTTAVENVDKELAVYLATCLTRCFETLRHSSPEFPQLSSTEKSEVYSLTHLALRLLLHILSNVKSKMVVRPVPNNVEFNQNVIFIQELSCKIIDILKKWLHDIDVPMDTKSVCGILCLMIEFMKRIDNSTPESWIDFLKHLVHAPGYWENDYAKLAMCSAIITTVPMAELEAACYDNNDFPAIVVLVQRLLDIVERSGSDGILILGASRALYRVSLSLRTLGCGCGAAVARLLGGFVWPQLDHYLDSVRHLAAQTLTALVGYCGHLERIAHTCDAYKCGGSSQPLSAMLRALSALGTDSRGFYAGVRGAAASVSAARVLSDVAPLLRLLQALQKPHLAATVSTTLDTLLKAHAQQATAEVLQREWVAPVLQFVEETEPDAETLAVLETLLARAVALEPELAHHIIPYVKRVCSEQGRSMKLVVMLLTVARPHWRGLVSYAKLRDAAVDPDPEIRLQCLSLVCGGAGGGAERRELELALYYLTYNINEQDPHIRQRALAMFKKLIKRIIDCHRSAVRNSDTETAGLYEQFREDLRKLCFSCLQPGANYARRSGALSLLAADLDALRVESMWKANYAEKLLTTLEDSYETNKAMALEILQYCPLKYLAGAQQIDAVIAQAGRLKPTESASAAFRLELIWTRLPHTLPLHHTGIALPAQFAVAVALLRAAGGSEDGAPPAAYDVLLAPRDRPTYGPLHCLARLMDSLDYDAIADDEDWRALIARIIVLCDQLTLACGDVVNTAAPEGALPGHSLTDNTPGVVLKNGQLVTAQMVLLCAWRTVKEAVTVLGAIGARARVPETLPAETLAALVRVLERSVASARHRGAVEQAYVAYERLLHRLWRDSGVALAALGIPRRQLARTLAWLRSDAAWDHPPDRRSAGLPFLVQALVGSEPGAGAAGTSLRAVMAALFERVRSGGPDDCAHSYNILRALYRHTALDTAIQSYVGEGLRIALEGFAGATWAERNSSTLLLSALMTRVFGVSRARSELSARNRMTGRVFYLRYPRLYDLMQNQLKEISCSEDKLLLSPSLYPVLLLLARLYPSSLEGTESNLQLVSFVPLVVGLARSRVERTRRLAAAACVSLVPPSRYVPHLEWLFSLISEPRVERNFCHGILLQIHALLQAKPDGVDCGSLARCVFDTQWLMSLAQHENVCYVVLNEWYRVLYLLENCFTGTLSAEFLASLECHLVSLVFSESKGINIGRALCLSEAWQLLLLLRSQRAERAETISLILRALNHQEYEVVDTTLDYLLRDLPLLRSLPCDCVTSIASPLNDPSFAARDQDKFCKHLEVLVRADAHELIACTLEGVECSDSTPVGDVTTLRRLVRLFMRASDGGAAPLLLESVASLAHQLIATGKLGSCALMVSRAMRHGARSGRGAARRAAARFLSQHARALLRPEPAHSVLPLVECYVYCAVSLLLQDEELSIRVSAERAARNLMGCSYRPCVASYTGERLLESAVLRPNAAILLNVIALQNIGAELELVDPLTDEYRVFDHNERHNVFLEELFLTRHCAVRLARCLRNPAAKNCDDDGDGVVIHDDDDDLPDADADVHLGDIMAVIHNQLINVTPDPDDALPDPYLTELCGDNMYHAMNCKLEGASVHPKVELFLCELLRLGINK